jgi:hypothetical protein
MGGSPSQNADLLANWPWSTSDAICASEPTGPFDDLLSGLVNRTVVGNREVLDGSSVEHANLLDKLAGMAFERRFIVPCGEAVTDGLDRCDQAHELNHASIK